MAQQHTLRELVELMIEAKEDGNHKRWQELGLQVQKAHDAIRAEAASKAA